eukprot:TRINITY_DN19293_c0_g1_i1.p1 TRINITY_DN19293_c0_g1~~TRINITY_DN19293_c0_g1_i1.p1  ORF type:complete len:1602 (+),score=394.28 TRINITY_DN19293_c0_g1_i1:100-4905(+)
MQGDGPARRSKQVLQRLAMAPSGWILGSILLTRLQASTALEVEALVEAAWPAASLAAELVEGLHSHGFSTPLLRTLSTAAETSEEAKWRLTASESAATLLKLPEGADSMFSRFLSLGARYGMASAKVEAARELERSHRRAVAAEEGDKAAFADCPAGSPWAAVTADGKTQVHCGVDGLKKLKSLAGSAGSLSSSAGVAVLQRSSLDHVLCDAAGPSLEVVGYADLDSAQAAVPMLRELFALCDAQSSTARVVFRHGQPAAGAAARRAHMVGYGVELLSKGADELMKSAGDEKANATADSGAAGKAGETCQLGRSDSGLVADPAAGFAGIDLAVLARRQPGAAKALCAFQEDLQAAVEQPIAPWSMKRLSGHLVLRAKERERSQGSPEAALASIEEVAQDFPAGWGYSLATGKEELESQARVRELLNEAGKVASPRAAGWLQVNGWLVPKGQKTPHHLLYAFGPLFRAVDMLVQAGFEENKVVELLQDSQSRPTLSKRYATVDPRVGRKAVVIHDSRGADDNLQRQLITLAQHWGHFIGFPPPLTRGLLGVGFTVDPCESEHLELVNSMVNMQPALAGVIWVHVATADMTRRDIVAKMRGALHKIADEDDGLQDTGAPLRLLQRFSEAGGCGKNAGKTLKKAYDKTWKDHGKEAPKIEKMDEDPAVASGQSASLPVPSATVNGHLLFGEGLTKDALDELCRSEINDLVYSIRSYRLEIDIDDEDLAKHQLQITEGVKPLGSWYPGISNVGVAKYVPILPDVLEALPGGRLESSTGDSDAAVVAHAVLLGEPDSAASLASSAKFLGAYADLLEGTATTSRWLGFAVSGQCAKDGGALTASAAMRRCLAALQSKKLTMAVALRSIAAAWSSVTAGPEGATILQACHDGLKDVDADVLGMLKDAKTGSQDQDRCTSSKEVDRVLGPVPAGKAVLAVNGRRLGPLASQEFGLVIGKAHIASVESSELAMGNAVPALRAAGAGQDPLKLAYSLAVRAQAIEEMVAARRGNQESEEEDSDQGQRSSNDLEKVFKEVSEDLKIHLLPAPGTAAPLKAFAVLDPLSDDAQRLPPLLRMLHKELNAEVGIILYPKQLVKPPILSFYRSVAPPLAAPGGLRALGKESLSVDAVRFTLPARKGLLLAMHLHAPSAWLCSAVDSGSADLDSLKTDATGAVRARYRLESLFLDGFALSEESERPAAGRQLQLAPLGGEEKAMAGSDSVVVKSGYFQLRRPPGLYQLTMRGSDEEAKVVRPSRPLALTELIGLGTWLEARIAGPKPQIVSEDSTDAYEGAGGDPKACGETIHIFSVASGHRYERLLRIMMMSVRKHTKCKLRLWLVDNFLSPSFRRILDPLGRRVGFAVSRVTYKWPHWLREQQQKQRIIWAYKILFLDVLFPTQIQRILFVDADQIVRADVQDVWKSDLEGKVYGMVPFCGSGPKPSGVSGMMSSLGLSKQEDLRNPDTEGFRFWEQGFWKNHLSDRFYYHISALFLVDLKKFRELGAGDILRDTYQSLTADPGSLANLDQDLPNYIQQALPIHSLPPEWLWCESWCSEASKKHAKTIDMCAHPAIKEGKLQQARRIAPEWVDYDAQLEVLIQQAETEAAAAASQ